MLTNIAIVLPFSTFHLSNYNYDTSIGCQRTRMPNLRVRLHTLLHMHNEDGLFVICSQNYVCDTLSMAHTY